MSEKLKKKDRHGPSNAAEVRLILEDEIASGLLTPGTRLEELILSERFGLSRTPIREALRLLSASGLVELRPHRGAVVSSPDLNQLLEMFEAMAEMEAMCARLAARRMTREEQEALIRQHKKCGKAAKEGNSDSYYEENARFHEVIYKGTHNRFLSEQVSLLRRRLQVYRRLQLRLPGRINDSFKEHSRVVDAIVSGDPQASADALHSHVTVQGDRFSDWIATLRASNIIAAEG